MKKIFSKRQNTKSASFNSNKIKSVAFTFLTSIFLIFSPNYSKADCITLNSTSGPAWSVTICMTVDSIVPTSSTCTWGYNFDPMMSYSITVSGAFPGNFYTLQGNAVCSNGSGFFSLPLTGNASGSVKSGGNIWRSTADCATATPESLGCNTVVISVQASGMNYSGINLSLAPVVLPIEIGEIKAEKLASDVHRLTWNTVSETNNSHFEVYFSNDGINFTNVGTVYSKSIGGNSFNVQHYSFEIESSTEFSFGEITYYQIIQFDLDGTSTKLPLLQIINPKAKTIEVKVGQKEAGLVVYLPASQSEYTIEIYNLNGQKIITQNSPNGGSVNIDGLNSGELVIMRVFQNGILFTVPSKVIVL